MDIFTRRTADLPARTVRSNASSLAEDAPDIALQVKQIERKALTNVFVLRY